MHRTVHPLTFIVGNSIISEGGSHAPFYRPVVECRLE
jgi:hypothetical protein